MHKVWNFICQVCVKKKRGCPYAWWCHLSSNTKGDGCTVNMYKVCLKSLNPFFPLSMGNKGCFLLARIVMRQNVDWGSHPKNHITLIWQHDLVSSLKWYGYLKINRSINITENHDITLKHQVIKLSNATNITMEVHI